MDVIPPPQPTEDTAFVSSPPPEPKWHWPSGRIVAGVAQTVALRLRIDPLWVRMAFVVLALLNGIGLLVYAGLWLVLVAGEQARGGTIARLLGGGLLIGGLPLLLAANDDLQFVSGPVAVVALLAGLALALWVPREAAPPAPAPAAPPANIAPVGEPRPSRPASLLGRATLGLAVLVAAVGALIDQLNGGRLHPEQWLGAAAAVCGAGLILGAWRGFARWLIVPAALFVGAGFVVGTAARTGGPLTDLSGDQWVWVGPDQTVGHSRLGVVFGDVTIDVEGRPAVPRTIEVAVSFGTIEVHAPQGRDVPIEIRLGGTPRRVRVDGTPTDARVIRLGPAGEPAVVIDARIGRGAIEIHQVGTDLASPGPTYVPSTVSPMSSVPGQLTEVSAGVRIAEDGSVVLGQGEVVIAPDDTVVFAEVTSRKTAAAPCCGPTSGSSPSSREGCWSRPTARCSTSTSCAAP